MKSRAVKKESAFIAAPAQADELMVSETEETNKVLFEENGVLYVKPSNQTSIVNKRGDDDFDDDDDDDDDFDDFDDLDIDDFDSDPDFEEFDMPKPKKGGKSSKKEDEFEDDFADEDFFNEDFFDDEDDDEDF